MKIAPLLTVFALVWLTACSSESMIIQNSSSAVETQHKTEKNPKCNDSSYIALECADTVTAVFDNQQQLWVAYVLANHIYLQQSSDKGESFAAPIQVNKDAENIAANGEYRPKLKFDQHVFHDLWIMAKAFQAP